jgi:hypothetical protein
MNALEGKVGSRLTPGADEFFNRTKRPKTVPIHRFQMVRAATSGAALNPEPFQVDLPLWPWPAMNRAHTPGTVINGIRNQVGAVESCPL